MNGPAGSQPPLRFGGSNWAVEREGRDIPCVLHVCAATGAGREAAQAVLRSAQYVEAERLVFLSEGIALNWFQRCRTRSRARAMLGVPVDRLVILVVGRLDGAARVDRAVGLIAQWPIGAVGLPGVELDVVGDEPERPELENLAGKLGMAGRVRLHVWPEDIRFHYEVADLLLVPGRSDRLPQAILEAMAMGVAVTGVAGSAVRAVGEEEECGLILSDRPWQWPGQIGAFLRDEEARTAVVRRAYRRVCERFDLAQRVQRELATYDPLPGRPRAQPVLRRAA